MASSWGKKLEKKLNGLADTASKESIQTLSNWIAFNRKHAPTIATILTKSLQECKDNKKRQWLYWQIIHDILLRENGNAPKWEKLGELRLALGEGMQPAMKMLGSSMPDELGEYIEKWEDLDVFGGISLNAQIRRLFEIRKNTPTAVGSSNETKASGAERESESSATIKKEPSTSPTDGPGSKADTSTSIEDKMKMKIEENEKPSDEQHAVPVENEEEAAPSTKSQQPITNPSENSDLKSPSEEKRTGSLKEKVDFDFESKNVPPGPIESREFLDPCKAITTLQIARDIRTNTAVAISTALENLPEDILSTCQDLDSGKLQELDTAMTNEFSIRIPSNLIDLDFIEETSSLNIFQDIVQRQQKARERLTHLLVRSRCNFGSMETAREFHEIDNLGEHLKKRKEALSDALELEGLDPNEFANDGDADKKKRGNEEILPPLTWYKQDHSNKVQKVS